jgi:mycothiol system anti-sigma-R factor
LSALSIRGHDALVHSFGRSCLLAWDVKGVNMEVDDPGSGCEETIERLYHFLDGELTEERRREIERHLDECAPCVRAYGFEAELRQVVANRCRDHVPESLVERVHAALLEEERSRGA